MEQIKNKDLSLEKEASFMVDFSKTYKKEIKNIDNQNSLPIWFPIEKTSQ